MSSPHPTTVAEPRNPLIRARFRRLTTLAAIILIAVVSSRSAWGKAVVRLEPTPAAPYSPGQDISIDVVIVNLESNGLPITSVQLDFTDTSAGIILPTSVSWLLSPASGGSTSLPTATWTDPGSTPSNTVPANNALTIARFGITLPGSSGCFALDVMNRADANPAHGAFLAFDPAPNPPDQWSAYQGQLLNGAVGFAISTATSAELCNGVDDDCDGLVDEDFFVDAYNPFVDEIVQVGPGATCVVGLGDCATNGVYACNGSQTALFCNAPAPGFPVGEGPYGANNCYDGHDNDCDGETDWEDSDCFGAELCDYADNDTNGVVDDPWPELGSVCTVGVGVCKATGVYICNPQATDSQCSSQPYPTNNEFEGPPDHPRCFDGLDNDCDGKIDILDPDCQEHEMCDGLDNDGDMQVDEDWPLLGQLCAVGVGACARTGVIECNASKTDTQCSVTPGAPTPEGPGCDCGDGIDNDCDGLTDLADPDCGAFIFRAEAALPTVCDVAGDCKLWRTVDYNIVNGGPSVTVEAEIVALDSNGQVLATLPVNQGDLVHFTSRSNPSDLSLSTLTRDLSTLVGRLAWMNCILGPGVSVAGGTCEVYDTDCDDDSDMADVAALTQLYPAPIVFHDVVAPISVLRVRADNGFARVTAYASPYPQVKVWHPDDSVVVQNDGDRVFVDIAIPETDPTSLTLNLDGVDVFAALGVNPANDLPGGPFGGSVSLPNGCTADICELIVDSADSQTLSANSIRMVVEGMCCGGHLFKAGGSPSVTPPGLSNPACEIDDTQDSGIANGLELTLTTPTEGTVDPAAPVAVSGSVCHGLPMADPPSAATEVELNGLAVTTSLPAVTSGDGVNTADRYSYSFSANLPETNLFNDFIGGSGEPGTVDPGSSYLVASATDPGLNAAHEKVKIGLGPLTSPVFLRGGNGVPRGLTLSITDTALEQVIKRALNPLLTVAVQELSNVLQQVKGTKFTVPTDAPCDPVVTIFPNVFPPPILIPPDINSIGIDVVFQNDQLDFTMTVPETRLFGAIFGRCEITGLFGECFIEVTVFVTLDVRLKQAKLHFSATEAELIAGADITPTLDIQQSDLVININDIGTDVGCWGGVVAQILSFGTFGAVVDLVVEDEINDYVNDIDVNQYLGMIPVPPVPLSFLDIDPIDLGNLDVTLNLDRTEVEITPSGMAVGLETEFVPKKIDPEVEIMPGLPDSQASLPQPPLGGSALGATLLVSDDAVNQMLNALTRNGFIKTQYEDVRTIPDFLPANCSTLSPAEEGQCVAMKGMSCGALSGPALVSCLATDAALETMNVDDTTPMILHGRLDTAPKFYIFRAASTQNIVSYFRLSQVRVGVIADRDGDGVHSGDFGAIPSCFGDNPGTQTPCLIWDGCFDVNVQLSMVLSTPANQPPEISFGVTNVTLSNAVGCGGGTGFPAGFEGLQDVFAGQVFNILDSQVSSVPPLKLDGLDFGEIMNLLNLQVLTHGNENDIIFEDYFGITVDPS